MKRSSAQLEPSIIVIFGITGDLSQRYLLPSLYHLIKDGLLHEKTEIVGISRRPVSVDQLFEQVELCVNEVDKTCDPQALKRMREHTSMVQLDLTDEAAYQQLLVDLNQLEDKHGLCMNRLYYLSIPPQIYSSIIGHMGKASLNTSCQHGVAATRLLVEKPFGYDLASAQSLIKETATVFKEEQVFRIDHYLAKETVQNILTFRFANPIFEALWSAEHIERIVIYASEEIRVGNRAQFYDPVGALRDFIQSHLIQLLAIVTMDRPAQLDSQHIHRSKQDLLRQVHSVPPDKVSEQAVRAQYESYPEEVHHETSLTETFAAVQVLIDSPRWNGVPIVMWSGKGLNEKKTAIEVTFMGADGTATNQLRFRIQPNEGIELDLLTKKPGLASELQTAAMDFSYQQSFGDANHPNAYERVLVDAVRGDHTLFATSEEVLEAWRIIQPVLDEWSKQATIDQYPIGSSGVELAAKLLS
jgi:glucose-6-phosphate 1-dehydrogenase